MEYPLFNTFSIVEYQNLSSNNVLYYTLISKILCFSLHMIQLLLNNKLVIFTMWKHQKRMRQNKNKCYKQVWCFWCWMKWISHVMQDLFILTKIYPISILFQSWNNLCSQLPNFEYHQFITCSYRYSAVKYYSLNKIYIYTGSYFHTVKIWKMLFSQMEKFLAIVTTRYVVHVSLKI